MDRGSAGEYTLQTKTYYHNFRLCKLCKPKYTIVETFVGCGGSHLGFDREGFETIFVNDIWSKSLETLKLNNQTTNFLLNL